jgi:hypothetical protein
MPLARVRKDQLVAAVESDVIPALGTREHGAHRDDQDVD